MFVKVVHDDEYENDTVERVVVVDEREDIHLAEDRNGRPEVFDADFEKTTVLADKAISIAKWVRWPDGEILVSGERWEFGPDPRREPDWYDEEPHEDEELNETTTL